MRWKVEWLVDRGEEPASILAYRFLKAVPVNVRIQLLAILEAVQTTGPDQWADRHSHCPMKGRLAAVGALAAIVAEDPPPLATVDDFIQVDLKR
jgi:hypothetical protein